LFISRCGGPSPSRRCRCRNRDAKSCRCPVHGTKFV
jgi:hypothetical protein